MKAAQFSPKPPSTVEVTTVLRILKNVQNLRRSKKKSHSDIEHRLFYLTTILFNINLLSFIALYVEHFHHAFAKNALLHTFVIFIPLSKRI